MNRISSKYGVASIDKNGYYVITSRKEGNNNKKLHRLVFEDFYGVKIPKDYVIHHINHNKLDNRIQNLQCVKLGIHSKYHNHNREHNGMFGKHHSEETKLKMSKAQKGNKNHMYDKRTPLDTRLKQSSKHNSSGYYRVTIVKRDDVKQGFYYLYQYYDDNKVRKKLSSVNIEKLKQKVIEKNLDWIEYR